MDDYPGGGKFGSEVVCRTIVPTFVPTQQTNGHSSAQPATCYDHA